jgi:oligopeptide transport system ATP-binding protein
VTGLAIEVRDLRKTYRVHDARGRRTTQVVAVDGISFSVPASESLAIVGESGAGKTTTGRIIVGLEKPTAGEVFITGQRRPYRRLGSRARRQLGGQVQIVFQDPYSSLDPRQRVRGALEEALCIHTGLPAAARHSRMRELLEQVGLDGRHADALPRQLSGGQRQRVAIARALACGPKVLILDEAVASLDVSIQAQVLNLLADIRDQTGITYLFISHDLAVVRHVSDQIIVMRYGAIVEAGRTGDVLDAPQHPYTQTLLEAVPRPGWVPRHVSLAARPGGSQP